MSIETKKITDEMAKMLREPLPPEAISQHPTKTYLSSIKAIYVVERLNKVFGIGTWQLESDVINDKTDMIVVKARLTIPEYGINLPSFGGNDNGGQDNKNFDLGDAYKGATTDALTKICSLLEIGIDVFKGQKTKPVDANGNPIPEKPYLNKFTGKNSGVLTKEWNGAVLKLQDGSTTIAKIKEHFRVSKENQTELETYIK
jgi:hypothetical protein